MLVQDIAGLYIPQHDYVVITYVAAGNGVGEIDTITYKQGGASGTTVAVMTLGYNADNKLATVTKV